MGDDEYSWMARNATESDRLNGQHRLLVKSIGYLLHPKISLGPNARVADIATGTAIIPLELAQSHPKTCQFDGFDISDAQFPPTNSLPKNINLHVADVKQPLPPEFHGKFDAVFIRYMNAAMRPGDWEIVVQNLATMLKPGGWLQWCEGDFSQVWYECRQEPRQETPSPMQEYRDLVGSKVKEQYRYFVDNLADCFRKAGLGNVFQEATSTDRNPETRAVFTKTTIGPMVSLLKFSQSSVPDGKSPEYCEQLMKRIEEEADAGAMYFRYDVHTFLGQKS